MATDDRVRGFPAFGPTPRRRGANAGSWWGTAWLKALEDGSLDHTQLKRGRQYAYAGRVGPITVSPGRIAATVQDHDEPFHSQVQLDQLTDPAWDRFLDRIAGKAGHIAALLDGDMPTELAAFAEDIDIPLLPAIGELEPECTCPGWEHPCQHAAALCYQVSWLLDADPFVLLLIRGRASGEVLEQLQRRGTEPATAGAPQEPIQAEGIPATIAFGTPTAELPEDPPPVTEPPSCWELPAGPEIEPAVLRLLAHDAALRARELLAELPVPNDDWQQAVRFAAHHSHDWVLDRLASAQNRDTHELRLAAAAWQQGGPAGLAVQERSWQPSEVERARAERLWSAAELPKALRRANTWTLAELRVQLRYGTDGHWYPYRQHAGDWWPVGRPRQDPGSAFTEL
ncbi:putative Zn finger protein [Tamaricihabitans halophyticus]|uniref:Putative Zn finger protein n=1 Tax=Tamaricihabitans halophyticus TaxID=1262583 RepID=A0A4R2QV95_9PSEU|nr:SWIM zinc finger family protein [Tamaricihabitans halophyticus]TCP50961.1 putative Zn finger protein [Tamaricihabitans halophyticus]